MGQKTRFLVLICCCIFPACPTNIDTGPSSRSSRIQNSPIELLDNSGAIRGTVTADGVRGDVENLQSNGVRGGVKDAVRGVAERDRSDHHSLPAERRQAELAAKIVKGAVVCLVVNPERCADAFQSVKTCTNDLLNVDVQAVRSCVDAAQAIFTLPSEPIGLLDLAKGVFTITDEAGNYEFRNVPQGNGYTVSAYGITTDGQTFMAQSKVNVGSGKVVDVEILTMQGTGFIQGTFLKEGETDHSGIAVSVLNIGPTQSTDSAGNVTLKIVPPGDWTVEARFWDQESRKCFTSRKGIPAHVESGVGTSLGTLELKIADCDNLASVSGFVLNIQDKPVVGAEVNFGAVICQKTAADGSFKCARILPPEQTIELSAVAPDGAKGSVRITIGAGGSTVSATIIVQGGTLFTELSQGPTTSTGTSTTQSAPPPTVTFGQKPAATSGPSVIFTFSCATTTTSCTLQCALDTAAFSACTSPHSLNVPTSGSHTFQVKGVDAIGQASQIASHSWSVDASFPDTTITSTSPAPTSPTTSTTATFTFESTESGSTFECSLDARAFQACTSPKTYSSLADGNHTFRVMAVDPVDNKDGDSPATITWTIDLTAPDTSITTKPDNPATSSSPAFEFTSTETGGAFTCKLDTAAYSGCTSPQQYTNLATGSHTFAVKSSDSAGNIDATPASYTWTINATCGISNCSGCCSTSCPNGCCTGASQTATLCGSGGIDCSPCSAKFICSNQACTVDPNSVWKLEVCEIDVWNTDANGSSWDVSTEPDVFIQFIIPEGIIPATGSTVSSICSGAGNSCTDPTLWDLSLGGPYVWNPPTSPIPTQYTTATAATLKNQGFSIAVWDEDTTYADRIEAIGWSATDSEFATWASGACVDGGAYGRIQKLRLRFTPQ